jgi:PAS domain S-box-containing protein
MRLRIGGRLYALVALFALGCCLLAGATIWLQSQRAMETRLRELRHLVEVAMGTLDAHRALAESGAISEDEAKKRAMRVVDGMRYNNGDYIFVHTRDSIVLVNPVAALIGKSIANLKDSRGREFIKDELRQIEATGEAIVASEWIRPETQTVVRKMAYVKLYRPWQLLVGTSVYMDDLTVELYGSIRRAAAVTLILLLTLGAVAILIARSIKRPLADLRRVMLDLAAGRDSKARIDTTRRDEIGEMARTVEVFRENAVALRQTEARVRCLVEANVIGIYFWDVNDSIVDANDAFLAQLGYTRQDIKDGKIRWNEMTPPEFAAVDALAHEELRATGVCRPYEKEYVGKHGRRIPVLIGGTYISESRDQGVAFVLDISERKRAESERHARISAEAANQAKSDFLAAMSHELRTPLNAILGYAQILGQDRGMSERQSAGIATIEHSGRHLLMLINDLLDLSKIEAGKFELFPHPVAPVAFIAAVGDIIRVKADEKRLPFVCDIAADVPPVVLLDDKRVRQVLLNLLGNAVKFTERGEVRLRVTAAPGDDATTRLRFEVRDTGVGMAPDELVAIFNPFEQVGDVRQRAGGTGLGLAIGRQLVRLMGSDIEVDSRLGYGSCFWFELTVPVVDVAVVAPAAPAAERVTGYDGPRRRVLVVDDVAANRAMLRDLLESLDFTTSQASDGLDAIEQISRAPPNLVLMDLVMPRMDGSTATRRIRAMPGSQRLPIIIVSASATPRDRATALADGANAFLLKPIDHATLLAEIKQQLGLTWRCEPAPARAATGGADEPLVIPPPDELAILHRIALAGNMRGIRDQAAELAAADPRYRVFAARLTHLARNFQSKAILHLVEENLDERIPT